MTVFFFWFVFEIGLVFKHLDWVGRAFFRESHHLFVFFVIEIGSKVDVKHGRSAKAVQRCNFL